MEQQLRHHGLLPLSLLSVIEAVHSCAVEGTQITTLEMFTISCIGPAFLNNYGTFMEDPSWYTVHSRKLPAVHSCGVECSGFSPVREFYLEVYVFH